MSRLKPIKRMRALKETYKIFNEIWENKLDAKPTSASKYHLECACCQYIQDRGLSIGTEGCQKCPLIELWPKGCEDDGSTPWMRWNVGGRKPEDAKEIADYCLKLILK